MCGIIGLIGQANREDVVANLIRGLRGLEYRGYDSAGIAVFESIQDSEAGGATSWRLARRRATGKLQELEHVLAATPLFGRIGIGHTRWATHGAVTCANAHPHLAEGIAIVHNGIIENFHRLRQELEGEGVHFESQTDTEVVLHLIARSVRAGKDPLSAIREVIPRLKGAFSLLILFESLPEEMVAVRLGSPLAVGRGAEFLCIGSDALALAPFSTNICYLENGDLVRLNREGVEIFDRSGARVTRRFEPLPTGFAAVEKGPYRHFMQKEIHEQPHALTQTLAPYLDLTHGGLRLPSQSETGSLRFDSLDHLFLTGCGTAYYATCVARTWFERYASLSTETEIASELRYRDVPPRPRQMALFVSQSGETADTLATALHAQEQGYETAAVVNVQGASLARSVSHLFPTFAGPEIGVASTKAFTCQLAVLACLALEAGRQRGVLDKATLQDLTEALISLPRSIGSVLQQEEEIKEIARLFAGSRHALYLGRGVHYPIALEAALKLKEISYIHAEGYAAGELKHGPIALIDASMPVVVLAPVDRHFEKTLSNLQEVAARGGKILCLTTREGARAVEASSFGERATQKASIRCFILPEVPELIFPFVEVVPLQLLAYHVAVLLGTDVDQPRNLAKSVTVE